MGVDLGTSFTVAAVSGPDGPRVLELEEGTTLARSAVRLAADGELVVGSAAVDGQAGSDATASHIKRRLGDPTQIMLGGRLWSAAALMAAILRWAVDRAEALEGEPPTRIVLSHPAAWGPYRQEHFLEVSRRAGLESVVMVTEPQAAAAHHAASGRLREDQVIAVYDLGGGTFDTTVLRVTGGAGAGTEILGVPEGLEWVGGIDFDEAVMTHVDQFLGGAVSRLDPRDPRDAALLAQIRAQAVRAKESLSSEEATLVSVALPGSRVQVPISREQFETMIRPAVLATLESLDRTVRSAGLESGDLAGVLLVGGSTRIPLVGRLLEEHVGRPVLRTDLPQHSVALGGALLAAAPSAAPPDVSTPDDAPVPVPPSTVRRRPRGALPVLAGVLLVLLVGGALAVLRPWSSPPPEFPAGTTGPVAGPASACLDVTNAVLTPGTTVQLFACNNTGAQLWKVGPGHTLQVGGLCLTRATPVRVDTCAGSPAQRWSVREHTVVAVGADQCLDLPGGSTGTGTPVIAQPCTGRATQRWSLLAPGVDPR